MHLPDGYLGPQTYVPAYVVMVPLWKRAQTRLKETLSIRQVPLLAMAAAFSFLVMMFNVPIPGGSTGHAVGSVLVAILLGPWAAVVAVSLALALQALLFGDGGITAYGANCLNMAVLMPFIGYGVYRLIAGLSPATSARRWIAGAVGGYVGINVAALSTGVMLGLQPLLAHDAAGHALYNPFGLGVAVPAMLGGHLLFFGWVEAIVTGLAVAWLGRTQPSLIMRDVNESAPAPSALRRVGWGLVALALLTPLGLYWPARAGAGSAWGEWGMDEVGKLAGYVPKGMAKVSELWRAPLPDYSGPGAESAALPLQSAWYILSAGVGIALLVLLTLALRRWLSRRPVAEASEVA